MHDDFWESYLIKRTRLDTCGAASVLRWRCVCPYKLWL